MKRLIITGLFTLIAGLLMAHSFDGLFKEANKYYTDNNFRKALELYDSIEESGYRSASLYFNMGNAYYKLEDYPKAILYYEKAKLSDHRSEDIQFNLELANLNTIDKIDPIPEIFIFSLWNNMIHYFRSTHWAIVAIVFLWTFLSLVFLVLTTRNMLLRKIFIPVSLLLMFILVFSFFATIKTYQTETRNNFAIVMEPTVYLKSAPEDNSTDLFIIHEGLKVEVVEFFDEWSKVKLSDGKIGWIKQESYILI